MKGIISKVIAAFVVVGFATPAIGGDQKPEFKKEDYIGLRAELRQADAVLRITVNEITSTKESPEVKITGAVISSLKGALAKPGDTLSVYVQADEHRRRYGGHWHAGFFTAYVPSGGDKGVFLLRKSRGRLEVVSIISDRRATDEFMKAYLGIAAASPEHASLELARFILCEAFEPGYSDEGRLAVLFIDWGQLYTHLPQGSETFRGLLNKYYPGLLEIDTYEGLQSIAYNVWLATFLCEAQRREVVKLLLTLHKRVDKRVQEIMEEIRTLKNPQQGLPAHGVTAKDAMRAYYVGLWGRLPFWIEIVMNPTIEDRKKSNFYPEQEPRKSPEEILKAAHQFIEP